MTKEPKATEAKAGANAPEADGERALNKTVTWDDSEMLSSYANVVNVINTREEFSLIFGTNQTWNLAEAAGLTVKLSNRVLLTPYAAKRLQILLAERMADYEKRSGALDLTR